jgi:hypothetical protein
VRPSRRREMAKEVVALRGLSVRLACDVFAVSESCYRYEAKRNAENEKIADWLVRLMDNNRNWGFGLCYLYLRNVMGFKWNHKLNGCRSNTGLIYRRFRCSQPSGCKNTITTAPIWPWAVSPQSSDWPWRHNRSTSHISGNRGDYHLSSLRNVLIIYRANSTDSIKNFNAKHTQPLILSYIICMLRASTCNENI